MAITLSNDGPDRLLPVAVSAFLRRRMLEGAGLALFAAAFAVATLLISFDPGDPSFNNATGGDVRNLLGSSGAHLADLGLQTLGLAAYAPVLVLALWAGKMVRKQAVSLIWLRLAALLFAMTSLAVAIQTVPAPEFWLLRSGLGGSAGAILTHLIAAAAQPMMTFSINWIVIPATSIAGTALMIFAAGVTAPELRTFFRTLGQGAGAVGRALIWTYRFIRRSDGPQRVIFLDEDDAPTATTPARKRAAKKPRKSPQVAAKAPKPKSGKRAVADRQGKLDLKDSTGHQLPSLEILDLPPAITTKVSKDALQQNAALLASVLDDFGVKGEIVNVRPGPVITLYELEPAPGTKTSRVIGLSDDIARSMSAISVRVAVIPGRNVIGIELPNVDRETVYLRELLESQEYEKNPGKLTLALGKDIGGGPTLVDLSRMPHLLIAGTTGSGKSVAVNTMILSLLYQMSPDECKFIMIDPKMLELSVYDGIPHLLTPVVTEPGKAVVALKWAVREMEERYRAMSQLGVRNIAGYNTRLAEARKKGETLNRRVQTGFDDAGKPVFEEQPLDLAPLPLIVIVVDEMADLMLVAGKDIEGAVQRLAQMARAAGIHLIMATQRPSVDVITGTIKANFPTRISFQVTSKIDSRTILGEQGAEQLLGQGDMLYMAGGGRITRVHGPFVSDEEVEDVVRDLKQQGEPDYIQSITVEPEEASLKSGGSSGDELYDQAVALIAREGKASTSFIQRHLQIGYNRAARIIEKMEKEGVVSQANRVGRREVLIPTGDDANY